MLNKSYDNALNIMLASDEKIKEKILMLIEAIPEELKEKIEHHRKSGEINHNGTEWSFANTGEDFGIIVGDKKKTSKDYISLYLRNIDNNRIKSMSKYDDYEYVGYVTFFLNEPYNKTKNNQLSYDCYLERKNNEYYIRLKGKLNSLEKQTKEFIEKCGFSDLAQSVYSKKVVKVKLDDILTPSTGRK